MLYNLNEAIELIYSRLNEKDELREKLIRLSRDLTRHAGKAIHEMVTGNLQNVESKLSELRELVNEINEITENDSLLLAMKFMNSGFEEYAEAQLLYHVLTHDTIPLPEDIGVKEDAYLLGLGDVIGELRRIVLKRLLDEQHDEARKAMEQMNQLFLSLIEMDFSKGLIPNLRHKIDRARAIIEKTEGDLTYALLSRTTIQKLEEFQHDSD